MDHQADPSRQQVPHPPASRSSPGLRHPRRFDGLSSPSQPSPSAFGLRPMELTATESWVEVSSQPSSSSLSSIGDEIVTAGLRVGGLHHRRRRLQPAARSAPLENTTEQAAETSSQEEYEESESESEDDQVLTSSAENANDASPSGPQRADVDSDGDSDEVDNATALGRLPDRTTFQPQPNAFSHPLPNGLQRRRSATSALPAHPHGGLARPSLSQRSQTRVHGGGPRFMSSSSTREDHDAALRASLTTLLSCAAAARGLPKAKEEAEAQRRGGNGVGTSNQPMQMRFVGESELLDDSRPAKAGSGSVPRQGSPQRSASPTEYGAVEKQKRTASAGRSPRATKKKRTATVVAEEALISPTLLSWVVSAGVVVLVSVVGFGAGYVLGREVGRQEALSASVGGVNETTHCGREVMRTSGGGLRRLRWAGVGRSIVAQA